MSLFSELFGGSHAASDAAAVKAQGLRQAQAYADPLYAQSRDALTAGYGKAQDIFQPNYAIGQQGAQAYADITGAGGQGGLDRARALFQTDPGYDFAYKEALRSVQRGQGTGGFQNSGNVQAALEDRASGLAQQQYGNYVQRLAPFLPYSLGAAGQYGGAFTGEGQGLAGNLVSQGQLGYGTEAGIGSATAGGILGDAASRQAAAGNWLKLLGYGVGAATGNPKAFANTGNLFFGGGSPSGYG